MTTARRNNKKKSKPDSKEIVVQPKESNDVSSGEKKMSPGLEKAYNIGWKLMEIGFTWLAMTIALRGFIVKELEKKNLEDEAYDTTASP